MLLFRFFEKNHVLFSLIQNHDLYKNKMDPHFGTSFSFTFTAKIYIPSTHLLHFQVCKCTSYLMYPPCITSFQMYKLHPQYSWESITAQSCADYILFICSACYDDLLEIQNKMDPHFGITLSFTLYKQTSFLCCQVLLDIDENGQFWYLLTRDKFLWDFVLVNYKMDYTFRYTQKIDPYFYAIVFCLTFR